MTQTRKNNLIALFKADAAKAVDLSKAVEDPVRTAQTMRGTLVCQCNRAKSARNVGVLGARPVFSSHIRMGETKAQGTHGGMEKMVMDNVEMASREAGEIA